MDNGTVTFRAIARIDRSFTSLSAAAPSALAPGHDPRTFSGCTLPTSFGEGHLRPSDLLLTQACCSCFNRARNWSNRSWHDGATAMNPTPNSRSRLQRTAAFSM